MKAINLDFQIEASSPEEVVVNVNGAIGDEYEGNDAKTFADLVNVSKGKRLVLKINSPGGNVFDGLQMHDLLAMHDAPVITEIYGASASAATIISQAGYRKMSANALMLVHHAWGMFMGNQFDLYDSISTLEKVDNVIVEIYRKKGANEEQIIELMGTNKGAGMWIDAETALEYGLIDEIFEPSNIQANAEQIKDLGLPELPKFKQKAVKDTTDVVAEAQSERRRRLITINKVR